MGSDVYRHPITVIFSEKARTIPCQEVSASVSAQTELVKVGVLKWREEFVSFYSILFVISFLIATAASTAMASEVGFAQKSNEFALDLYSKIVEGKDNENVIISPFSIQTCVALAFAGANGETADQMAKGLRLVSGDRVAVAETFKTVLDKYADSPLLKIANKVYVQKDYSLKPAFNEIAVKSFHSEAETLDFKQNDKSAQTINDWVEDKTNKKIKDLISANDLDSDTRLVLVNAIYFKGNWETKFKPEFTKMEDFWISETESVKVDMMNQKSKFKYGLFDDLDATALEMPFKSSDLSMLIILPNAKTGLKNLEAKLQGVDLLQLTQSNMFSTDVIVKLPKFKIEFSTELREPLEKMGMTKMFADADFSNLLDSKELLKVSKVVHKAFIEVNEEGAEAAAATAGMVRLKRSLDPNQPEHFIADHPFRFLIYCKTSKMQLFSGALRLFLDGTKYHDEL